MKIALIGDIAFYGKYSLNNNRIFDYFNDVASFLGKYDYVVGNLESPICGTNKPRGHKSAYIKSELKNVELLKYLNIDAVNLSNNHIFDYGVKGANETKQILQKNNIAYFGTENNQLLIEKKNCKLAFSGYCCYSTNALGYYNSKKNIGVNILNAFKVEEVLINNDKRGYLNIASFHIGQEHVNHPNYDHILMARKFANKVPYIFYGHHPHVMQGIEEIENSLLAYSLGNFCFDDVYTTKSSNPLVKQSIENKKSYILSLEIDKNKILKFEMIPLYAGESKMNVGVDKEIIDDLNSYSKFLNLEKDVYQLIRQEKISNYITNRKKNRDLHWYLKRLNLNSIGMIINSKLNQKKYEHCIKDYIDED